MQYSYKDIILRHGKSVVASRSECDTSAMLGSHLFAVPVVMANMQSLVTPEICKMFDDANWFYVYHRIGGVEDVKQFVDYAHTDGEFNIISISVGVKPEWVQFIKEMHAAKYTIDYFTVDVALSYNDNVNPVLKTIQELYPEAYVICGNGATDAWVRAMKYKPVDCIKVGIGVSNSCRTRQYTGFGSTTVTSLLECKEAAKKTGMQIADRNLTVMSDGGITVDGDTIWVGDIAKALVLGADWVMSGALFSKCLDSPSLVHGYFGNASARAKENSHHVEGTTVQVVSSGLTIKETMKLIQDSLRSSISYSGGKNIQEMKEKTKWDYVN